MAYAKIGFKDRVDNKPDSYLVNGTETTVVKNDSGLISKGTNLNKATFEHMEGGIYQNSVDITNVSNIVTNNKNEFDTFKTETTSQLADIEKINKKYTLSESTPSTPNINDRWDKILGDSISFETGDGAIFGNASLEPNSSIWFKEI